MINFGFGVNESTRVESDIPFPVGEYFEQYNTRKPDGTRQRQHPFAIGELVSVSLEKYVAKDATVKDGIEIAEGADPTYDQVIDEDKVPMLSFEFTDGTHVHTEKFGVFKSQKHNNLKAGQIAQLYVVITDRPKDDLMAAKLNEKYELGMEELGPNDTNIGFEKYYTGIVKAFEEHCEFGKDKFRLKLVRQGTGGGSNRRNYLQFSLGNFIEKVSVPLEESKLTVRADDQFAEIAKPEAEDVSDIPTATSGGGTDPWSGSNM
jgi:hypothetical protein